MKIIRVKVGRAPELVEIDNTLDALQAEVGGYIQAIYPFDDPVALICDEEGKLKGKEPNKLLMNAIVGEPIDIIVGDFLIVGLGEEDFTDIGEYQKKYTEKFKNKIVYI